MDLTEGCTVGVLLEESQAEQEFAFPAHTWVCVVRSARVMLLKVVSPRGHGHWPSCQNYNLHARRI